MFIPTLAQADAIARDYSTPTYVTDAATIRDRARQIREGFAALPTKVFYAVKSNYNPHIVRAIKDAGVFGIDAVSPLEVQLALDIGYAPEQIVFTGSNASDEEMRFVGERGVLQNVGSLSELDRLGRLFPGTRVSVRLSPGIGEGEFAAITTGQEEAKFGVTVADFAAVREITARHGMRLVGIHSHIGSGFYTTDKFDASVAAVVAVAKDFQGLEFLDFGGGFGVTYDPAKTPIDLSHFAAAITPHIRDFEHTNGKPIEIRIEPGKFLVSQSTVLLVRVTTIKRKGATTFVGVDAGFNNLIRPAMYDAYHHIVNLSNPDGAMRHVAVAGNVCETCDVFNGAIDIAEPREGDILAILVAGGYGSSMSSNYNLRPLVAEVMIDGDDIRLTRRRQTYEDIVSMYTPFKK